MNARALGQHAAEAGDSLRARLELLAAHQHQRHHAWYALLRAGRFDRAALRLWLGNVLWLREQLARAAPARSGADLALSSEAPRATEHGAGSAATPVLPGQGEDDLWGLLGAALGCGADELAGTPPLPGVHAACDEYLASARRWQPLAAATLSLAELSSRRALLAQLPHWRAPYPLLAPAALEPLDQRVGRAAAQADAAFDVIESLATSAELEQCALEAFAARCTLDWRLLDAVYLALRVPLQPGLVPEAWLLRLTELAVIDERGRSSAPGVLMAPGRVLQLNPTAYDLLALCDGRTLAGILAELTDLHAVALQIVERDVATFLAELERRELLVFASGSGR